MGAKVGVGGCTGAAAWEVIGVTSDWHSESVAVVVRDGEGGGCDGGGEWVACDARCEGCWAACCVVVSDRVTAF